MSNDLERRTVPVSDLRAEGSGKSRRIVGHAALFNSLSLDLGGFRERIDPGAFEGAERADVRALFNHDPNHVLGRTKAGTLKLKEDERGLLTEIHPPDTQLARDLATSIARGDVDQMSFGFRTLEDAWEKRDGENIRILKKVELFDVSPVTFPAYPETHVSARALDKARELQRSRPSYDFDQALPELPGKPASAGARSIEDYRARLDIRERLMALDERERRDREQDAEREARSRPWRDTDPKRTAYHEAGHAVEAVLSGAGVGEVSLRDESWNGSERHRLYGHCSITRGPATVARRLAGVAAEDLEGWNGPLLHERDGERALDMLNGDRQALESEYRAVRQVLKQHWPAVEKVAKELLRRGRLSGADVAHIVSMSPTQSTRDQAQRRQAEARAQAARWRQSGRSPWFN